MRRRTILIVEDDQAIAHSLEARLRTEGFEVALAGDGPGGVEAYLEHGPDLVVLDLGLPDLPGEEVARTLRTGSNVPIISRQSTSMVRRGSGVRVPSPAQGKNLTLLAITSWLGVGVRSG